MKMTIRIGLSLGLALLLGAPSTQAGFTFDLYETSDNTPDNPLGSGEVEVGPVVTLPSIVNSGYVVLLDSGDPTLAADQRNQSLWSDVVQFAFDSERLVSTVQLISDPASFPSVSVVLAGNSSFILESATVPTVYLPGTNVYNIYSGARGDVETNPVPEPSSLLMGATGVVLAAFAGYRRHRAVKTA